MEIGQKVYVKKVGNAARNRERKDLVTEEEVTKIGNKYFFLKGYTRDKFSLKDMMDVTNYSHDYKVYLTRQEIEDEFEYADKIFKIKEIFEWKNRCELSLDQLRKIYNIIFGE